MSFWNWLLGSLDGNTTAPSVSIPTVDVGTVVNPATGLSMLSGGMSGVDAGGSLYGMDSHASASWHFDTFSGSGIGSAME